MSPKKVFSFFALLILAVGLAYPEITVSLAGTPPVAQFSYSPEKPLINETIVFDASESYDPDGDIVSYKWNFGDGSPNETLPTPLIEHKYSAYGNYTVTLVVTDNDGLESYIQKTVTVIDYPTANFTYSPDTPLVGETVTFDASESEPNGGTIVSYNWDFGDNSAPVNTTSPTTTHAYESVGNYTITLTVVDSEGLADTVSGSIIVINYPIANFTYSPSYPLVNETVTFDASASEPDGGTIVEYFWDFGDGTNATGVVVTHAYKEFGTFLVNLTVTDSEGLSNSQIQEINVRQHPEATFVYSPTLPLIGETVTFDASGSKPNGGTIVSYSWDFGDNTTGSGVTVTHVYSDYGTFNVVLTVTDDEGLSDTYIGTIRVIIAPTANFTYSPKYPAVNQTVTFNASSSFDPDGEIVSYIWDFGDGNITTVSTPIVTHIYKSENTYEVTLTIVDDDGLTDSTSQMIVVYTVVPIHDVAVLHVETNTSWAYRGDLINITVVVANEGNIVEKFNLTLYYNDNEIHIFTDIYLSASETITLTFIWNTSTVIPGNYSIRAIASIVEMEEDVEDNTFTDGAVSIVFIDVNGDGKVDITDIAIVAKAFGSNPELPTWDPRADLNGDGKVDITDIAMVAVHFGETV